MVQSHHKLTWLNNPQRAITVELVIFLYIAGVLLENPIMQQYLYDRAKTELNTNQSNDSIVCNEPKYINHTAHHTSAVELTIQQKASKYILAVNLALTLPALIMACFLGPWSDRRGRKPLMLIVSTTASLQLGIVLLTIYMKWPVYVFMIATSVGGLGGYYPTMVTAILAYAADTTPPKSRALKLGILEALAFLGGTIGQFASGFWIEKLGFKATFWLILSFHLINIVYIAFFLPESLPNCTAAMGHCFSLDNIKPVITVYTKKRQGRWILFVLLFLSVIYLLAQFITTTLIVLYSKSSPLCWTATIIGYFSGTLLFSKAFGAVVGIWGCSRLKLTNYTATQFGTVFLIGNLLMIGFSTTTLQMFLSCIIGIFSAIPKPCLGAQLSQMVGDDEQGALFSVFASLESLCNFCSQLIFNPLYSWFIENVQWKYAGGIPFMINAGLAVIPILTISFIKKYTASTSPKEETQEPEPLLQEDLDPQA